MMKATLSSAVLLGLLVWSVPSFAEVQNVKVSGDVTLRGFWRTNLDLHGDGGPEDSNTFWTQTTGLNVSADLTENVSAFLRVVNERDWNRTGSANAADIDLSQAYITLKELFYAPVTVRLGTQPLWFGRGFVVGSSLLPGVLLGGLDPNAAITPDEYSDFTAFDAIRATLDLSNVAGLGLPITADAVYAKIDENAPGASDDINLVGVNLGTKFNTGNSEAETYWWIKQDKSLASSSSNAGTVNTIGLRGSAQPVEGALVFGEVAYQFGKRAPDPTGTLLAGDSQQAWATDFGIEYTLANVATTPKLGWEWIFWSGNDVDGAVNGWDPMFRGYFTTALREFQSTGLYPTDQAGDTNSVTNQHQLAWYGSLRPIEDLTLSTRYTLFILDDGAIPVAGSKRKSYAGSEWDTNLVYNYTSDVQFGLLYALFAPGNVYRTPSGAAAQELVSTVSVKF